MPALPTLDVGEEDEGGRSRARWRRGGKEVREMRAGGTRGRGGAEEVADSFRGKKAWGGDWRGVMASSSSA